jgi:rhodanese-related sulfurtransferase
MNWLFVIIVVAALAVFFLFKHFGQISANDAQALLKNGALIVDVRTPGEYNSGHLANAINIPLDEIEETLPRHVKDRSEALLLHCQSGMRSGIARKKLKALGYTRACNLGSYQRAAQIVGRG